jgi:16S rRNA C967 or C1407 C5-methylase (RsmB/RsmF family)
MGAPEPGYPPLEAGIRLPDWLTKPIAGQAPGSDPMHEAGRYYVLDVSSAVLGSIVLGADAPGSILDLCAAPGGKAALSWRAHRPDRLAANEVHPKRVGSLVSNLKRCGVGPAWVTRMDPSVMAEAFPECFGLVVVDAPCSGQSMIAKGEDALGAFHPQIISMNSQRQKRILACAAACLAPGGWLASITCTYAREENEEVIEWLIERFPELEPIPVGHLEPLRSPLADFPAYRVFPHRGPGAGGFACLLRRRGRLGAHQPAAEALTERAARFLPGPEAPESQPGEP